MVGRCQVSESIPRETGVLATDAGRPFWREVFIRTAALLIAVGALYGILLLARPLAILVASAIIAIALEPLVDRLETRLPRGLAAIMVYAVLVLIVLGLLFTIGVIIADEAPSNCDELVDLINRNDPFGGGRLVEFLENQSFPSGGVALRIPLQIVSTVAEMVIAFFLSIYWVIAAPSLRRYFLSIFPDNGVRQQTSDVLDAMGQKMGGYVRAITIDGIILAIATYIGLSLLGVRFPIVLAIFSGISVLVPIIGPIAAAIPAILIALIDSPLKAAAVLAFYIILQQVESNVLMPKIMQRQANINPLLGVFAVFAGGSIDGILGALIAVPTAGAIQVLVTHVLVPAIRDRHEAGGVSDSHAPP